MSDIVEQAQQHSRRCRHYEQEISANVIDDLIAEIERLQTELAEAREQQISAVNGMLKAEMELLAERERCAGIADKYSAEPANERHCRHEIWEQESACADGMCPICLCTEIERLRTPICIGRPIIGILAKEGGWKSENGASVVAADELLRNDPYAEIERLRAELAAERERCVKVCEANCS